MVYRTDVTTVPCSIMLELDEEVARDWFGSSS